MHPCQVMTWMTNSQSLHDVTERPQRMREAYFFFNACSCLAFPAEVDGTAVTRGGNDD